MLCVGNERLDPDNFHLNVGYRCLMCSATCAKRVVQTARRRELREAHAGSAVSLLRHAQVLRAAALCSWSNLVPGLGSVLTTGKALLIALPHICSAFKPSTAQNFRGIEHTPAEAASMDTHGKTQEESPAGPRVCSNGCGFFA